MTNDLSIDIPVSILELATVVENQSIQQTFSNIAEVAQTAEALGYSRFWLAEHHNMDSVASSATAVLIGYIAGKTKSIRVGSGGIMLPNHAPLIVAEQFGTLATIYPHRIDLGLGRAPGTDPLTARALRRDHVSAANMFPLLIDELMTYFSAENKTAYVRAIPGEGVDVPVWILGSSTDSAWLAAELGLPYAFASHFAPAQLHAALSIYHQNFKPGKTLSKPYTMACVNVIAADTDEEAQFVSTSFLQLAKGIITGARKPLPPPVKDMETVWTPQEEAAIRQMMAYSFVGNKETVEAKINRFIADTRIDEIMVASHIFDQEARLTSFRILGELMNKGEVV